MKNKMFDRISFCLDEKSFHELQELSRRTGIPRSVFLREALNYSLKKYRYILTMEKFNAAEARYFLAGSRGVNLEEMPLLISPTPPVKKRRRLHNKQLLLDFKRRSNGEDQP